MICRESDSQMKRIGHPTGDDGGDYEERKGRECEDNGASGEGEKWGAMNVEVKSWLTCKEIRRNEVEKDKWE